MNSDRSDEDPTGIRHLLSGMSDPQPMSDDLVARISCSLADERRMAADDPVHRFDPAVKPPARRPWSAVAVVGGVATLGLLGVVGAHLLSGAPTGQRVEEARSALESPPTAPASSPPESLPSMERSPTASAAGAITVVASGTRYHPGRLTQQARRLAVKAPDLSPTTAVDFRVTTCLNRITSTNRAVADVASLDGHDVIVLVQDTSAGSERMHTVQVLPIDCATSGMRPLLGPYSFR